jgi:regulator of protease activity HflC (stomatin/prohibitin superfamily)
MEAVALIILLIVVVGGLLVLTSSIRIVQQYEHGIVFRFGQVRRGDRLRPGAVRPPGLTVIIPIVERMQKVNRQTVTMNVPAQEGITQDNVSVRVDAVVYFRVIDPVKAIVNVQNYGYAVSQIGQTSLRSVIGQTDMQELLGEREKINQQLQVIIDEQTEPWGVKVSVVEVKDVELPQSMQRAMARQAEAEREKRAKIIHAEGEFQASKQLAEAAEIINQNPVTIQLRYLQTLTEIGAEKNTTVVFPLPIDMVSAFVAHGTGQPGRSPEPSLRVPPPSSAEVAPPPPVDEDEL